MAQYINRNFIPVRIHIKEQPASFKRFGAQWTPTVMILDPEGREHHRFEGFLPAEDYLAQLELGQAKSSFARENFSDAEERFRQVVDRFPDTDAAPEALYWAGVSRYKGTDDPAALSETGEQFTSRYSDSTWAKKASVWLQPAR